MSLNQEVPQICTGINPHQCLPFSPSKIGSSNQKSGEITPGIKPCDVYHVYTYKMCLEIKNVMKISLVSMLVTSNIIFIMFSVTQ